MSIDEKTIFFSDVWDVYFEAQPDEIQTTWSLLKPKVYQNFVESEGVVLSDKEYQFLLQHGLLNPFYSLKDNWRRQAVQLRKIGGQFFEDLHGRLQRKDPPLQTMAFAHSESVRLFGNEMFGRLLSIWIGIERGIAPIIFPDPEAYQLRLNDPRELARYLGVLSRKQEDFFSQLSNEAKDRITTLLIMCLKGISEFQDTPIYTENEAGPGVGIARYAITNLIKI